MAETTDTNPEDARASAFELLERALGELASRNRLSTAAAVRSEMNHLSADGFSLSPLHFDRFRDFLDAAEAAGRVNLARPAAGLGSDTMVSLPGRPIVAPTTPTTKGEPLPKVLWQAFVRWDARLRRVADAQTGEVSIFPTEPVPFEPEHVTSLRAAADADPVRYVAIEPADIGQQLEWAKSFVAEVDLSDEDRAVLEQTFSSSLPLKSFTTAIRGLESQNQKWHAYRLAKVRGYVDAWSKRTGISPSSASTPVAASSASAHASYAGAPTSPVQDASVRARLLRAIGSMTLEELLELRLPARLLLDER
ncbi:UPF0158 family protein [Cellulomonas endometrii]|uniref:UPF0158 family protein n=1 Tax=Cellulomonas endometrii TaxID=3036301 RepID=UPI0024AD0F26|nr:UPF0158 family protein [Cellulomonas endometrii]